MPVSNCWGSSSRWGNSGWSSWRYGWWEGSSWESGEHDRDWGSADSDGEGGEDGVSSTCSEASWRGECAKAVHCSAERPGSTEFLEAYLKTLPHDTFCGQGTVARGRPWQCESRVDCGVFRLPTPCMMRRTVVVPEDCVMSVVADIALKELCNIGEVDYQLRPLSGEELSQPK